MVQRAFGNGKNLRVRVSKGYRMVRFSWDFNGIHGEAVAGANYREPGRTAL
jgi:hypothetical protein